MEYEVVVGLEIHAELATKTKIFCGCLTKFGGGQNTHCCPVCTGMPGTLPVLNERVVEYAVRAGLAMHCEIAHFSKLDRKNYFYPDLPKAYQISQYDLPLCKGGYVELGSGKKIGLTRIHIEEDAGKLIHDPTARRTYVDYNRCGVPLIEIVSEPDMRGAAEAREYAERVRAMLLYTGVSDCRMEEGSLRADVNISVMPRGSSRLGTRTEIKNLNSMRAIERAVQAEADRQQDLIESGGAVKQQTLRWDDARGELSAMRGKEEANDYRYFPEPDIVPITLTDEKIDALRATLPELPEARLRRYISSGLPEADARIITASKPLADFFEAAAKACGDIGETAKWTVGELSHCLRERGVEPDSIPFPPEHLAKIITMVAGGEITAASGKKVLEMLFGGETPDALVEKHGLAAVSDDSALDSAVNEVISENPQSVSDYLAGKQKAAGFLMGRCMRHLGGRADAVKLRSRLTAALEAQRGK
jgi:aspartyl-tRNA(Asn)/glutamyl-tRNA(Gln) amidotransferase subunit B